MNTEKWTKNSFDVEAVQVTAENIDEVAIWCGGRVFRSLSNPDNRYIHLHVIDGSRMMEAKIFPDFWIVSFEDEFRKYSDAEFKANFRQPIPKLPDQSALRKMLREELKSLLEAVALAADYYYGAYSNDLDDSFRAIELVAENAADRILHDRKCAKQTGSWKSCTCGVGDES